MIEKAAGFFAKHGFDASTRDLAKALGITQALIYRHFKSKDDLIDQTLAATLGAMQSNPRPGSTEPEALADATVSLEERLTGFYGTFVAGATQTRMRLFMRAGLDGRSWPQRRGAALTTKVFEPVIAALRSDAGLPAADKCPLMRGERELAMMLHASMVFLGIRRHVYGMPMPESLDDIVRLYLRTWLAGAVPAIRDLHEKGEERLTLPLLTASSGKPAKTRRAATSPGRKRTSNR
ncbi:MAG TPA: helix-turn-helix domain-containing protein [Afifellaceae bacterium]|nr:helix-turn-helix domain-containing protein [Afifellaceae bacterium]